MRIRPLTPLLLCLVFATSAGAVSEEKHFLWEVTSERGSAYLLGSIHLGKQEFYPLPPVIEGAFDRSDVLAVEADPGAIRTEQQQEFLRRASLPSGRTLRDVVSDETYRATEALFQASGIDFSVYKGYRPWFVALAAARTQFGQLGFSPELGLDKHFLGKARGQKPVEEMEGFDGQLELLSSFSKEEDELFLLYMNADIERTRQALDRIVDRWRRGDADAIEREFLSRLENENPLFRQLFEKLFFQRNREMAARVESFLSTGDVHFVVVGAAHLVGDRGVPRLLEERGYTVRQL